MISKTLATLAALIACSVFIQLVFALDAQACSPGMPHHIEIESDDSPDCFSHAKGATDSSIFMHFHNDCDAEIELQALDCSHCDTSAIIAAGENAEVTLETRLFRSMEDGEYVQHPELEDGDVSDQHYLWTMDDAQGNITTQVTYRDNSDDCSGCHCSTNESKPDGSAVLIFLLLATLVLYRRVPFAGDAHQ